MRRCSGEHGEGKAKVATCKALWGSCRILHNTYDCPRIIVDVSDHEDDNEYAVSTIS